MPAVNFRRFSKPEVLSTVEPRLLLRLLSRHEAYFSGRGCALTINGNGCLNYSGIIETILSPDQKMPPDLIDALYFTHELATPKGLDAILGALGKTNKLLCELAHPVVEATCVSPCPPIRTSFAQPHVAAGTVMHP